jgi:hypothetical protein
MPAGITNDMLPGPVMTGMVIGISPDVITGAVIGMPRLARFAPVMKA